jgi:hypothetical protein
MAATAPGCQMVYFQTKNSNIGTFWKALERKMLVFFTILNILWPFGILSPFLVCFVAFLVHISKLGILCREKSGNPAAAAKIFHRTTTILVV